MSALNRAPPLSTANKKLIRRWDSERELFHDDIIHVLQSTKIML